MNYDLDPDLKHLVECFEKEGYKEMGTTFNTTHIKDSKGYTINAYMEPMRVQLKRKDYIINIEFYLRHERAHMKRKIKKIEVTPKPEDLTKVINCPKIWAEAI